MDTGAKICKDHINCHCGFIAVIRKCVEEKCSQDERDLRIMDWIKDSLKANGCETIHLDFDIFSCVDEIIEKKLYV